MDQVDCQPFNHPSNQSGPGSSCPCAPNSVAPDHGEVEECHERHSVHQRRGSGQISIRSRSADDLDAIFDQLHVRGRQHSNTSSRISEGIVDLDVILPRRDLETGRRSRSSSKVHLSASDYDGYIYPDSPVSTNSPYPDDVPQCSECGNLLPELSERPREMTLARLSQSADQGCNDCRLLVEGYVAYTESHPEVPRGTGVSLQSLNTGGPLRVKVCHDDHPKGTVLEFYTATGTPSLIRNLEPASHLYGRRTFDESIHYAQQWLEQCLNGHPDCGVYENVILPKRVLDLSYLAETDTIFLREQDKLAKSSGRYACLSYCWGGAPRFMTTTANLSEMKNGIQFRDMPKTFADAVTVCVKLGIQYLWIDALCIIQADLSDWTDQSVLMSSIYGQSYITIIASNAESSHAGFISDHFFEEPILLKSTKVDDITVPGSGSELVRCTEVWVRTGLDHSAFSSYGYSTRDTIIPTRQRAWCLQEHLMPPRTISFGPSEIVFECKLWTNCECGYFLEEDIGTDSSTRFDHYQSLRTVVASPHLWVVIKDYWLRLVENFSSRATTFDSDRLIALAGVAEAFQKEIKCRYLAGLWEEGLFNGLMWETSGPTRRNTSKGLPTWSWASIVGQTEFRHGHDAEIMEGTRLLEVQYDTATPNIFGAPTIASLRILGCILQVNIDISTSSNIVSRNGVDVKFSMDIRPFVEDVYDESALFAMDQDLPKSAEQVKSSVADPDSVSQSNSRRFYAWIFGKVDQDDIGLAIVRMLILQAVDGEASRFKRIGVAETAMYDEYDPMMGFAPLSKFFKGYWEEEDPEFTLL